MHLTELPKLSGLAALSVVCGQAASVHLEFVSNAEAQAPPRLGESEAAF